MKIGYLLSGEEWRSGEQLEQARMAEEAGFEAIPTPTTTTRGTRRRATARSCGR